MNVIHDLSNHFLDFLGAAFGAAFLGAAFGAGFFEAAFPFLGFYSYSYYSS
jgi:hypothetical protein